jgi:hypothetical protein
MVLLPSAPGQTQWLQNLGSQCRALNSRTDEVIFQRGARLGQKRRNVRTKTKSLDMIKPNKKSRSLGKSASEREYDGTDAGHRGFFGSHRPQRTPVDRHQRDGCNHGQYVWWLYCLSHLESGREHGHAQRCC